MASISLGPCKADWSACSRPGSLITAIGLSRVTALSFRHSLRRMDSSIRLSARQGAYDAARAAALSGVPRSTVYDWSQKGIVVPSVRRSKIMLWSYEDLLTLRLVRWLREEKVEAARSTMEEVRRTLDRFGDDLWTDLGSPTIGVLGDGTVVHLDRREASTGQGVLESGIDLLARFESGVDLRAPRPQLRIVPGRCGSEIHLLETRVTSLALYALSERGYSSEHIQSLYPESPVGSVDEALEVEQALSKAA